MRPLQTFRSLAGQLLIASPLIHDGIFFRTVIFLTEHSKNTGAKGFIINKSSGRKVKHAIADGDLPELSDVPAFIGGPVSDNKLLFGSMKATPDNQSAFTSARTNEEAVSMMFHSDYQLFAYIGYSSWTPGQLESELSSHTWYISPPQKSLLTHDLDRTLWRHLLRDLSPYHAIVAETPEVPLAN